MHQVLQGLLKERTVTKKVLLTVIAEASNILNSRPLTCNSDDSQDEKPLTSNHLIRLRPSQNLPCTTCQMLVATSTVHSQPVLEVVREAKVQKYMVYLSYRGAISFYVYIVPSGLISTFLDVECDKISCGFSQHVFS